VTAARRTVRPRPPKRRRRRHRPSPPRPLETLLAALEDRGRRVRRRLSRGIPISSRRRTDAEVHDLRTSARRLQAALEALGPFVGAKQRRRLGRRIEGLLDASGALRDLGVELEMLPSVPAGEGGPALAALRERIRDRHEREASRLHRRLRDLEEARFARALRRLLKTARRETASAPVVRRAALGAARDRFAGLRESRLAVDPTDVESIHRMRIELKTFRYLMEALGAVAMGVGRAELEALHRLQTTMGDLHDLEVLSSTVARHVARRAPESAASLAPVLETLESRHSAMLVSFLETVDPTLDSWKRLLASERRWASGR
jgi:CHAD domain-containing protein